MSAVVSESPMSQVPMSLFRPLKYYFELDCIVHSYQAILNPSISIHYFIVVLRIGKAAIWLFSDQRITGPVDTFDTHCLFYLEIMKLSFV